MQELEQSFTFIGQAEIDSQESKELLQSQAKAHAAKVAHKRRRKAREKYVARWDFAHSEAQLYKHSVCITSAGHRREVITSGESWGQSLVLNRNLPFEPPRSIRICGHSSAARFRKAHLLTCARYGNPGPKYPHRARSFPCATDLQRRMAAIHND